MRFLPSPEGIFMKLDWTKEGVNINSKQLTSLWFTDDAARLHKNSQSRQSFLGNSLIWYLPSPEGVFMKLDYTKEGVNINRKRLAHLWFTDEVVLIAEAKEDLWKTIIELGKESGYVQQYTHLEKKIRIGKQNRKTETELRRWLDWATFWQLLWTEKLHNTSQQKYLINAYCVFKCAQIINKLQVTRW